MGFFSSTIDFEAIERKINHTHDKVLAYWQENGCRTFIVNDGDSEITVTRLVNDEEMAICTAPYKKGQIFNEHAHLDNEHGENIVEFLICVYGSFTIIFEDDSEVIIKEKESLRITSDRRHKVIANEDSKLIAITIPADKNIFP